MTVFDASHVKLSWIWMKETWKTSQKVQTHQKFIVP